MKLTRKQTAQLESILYHLKRAEKYLMDDQTVIAKRASMATTTLHYSRASDNTALYPVAKDIGSDLCGLFDAIKQTQQLLLPEA